MRATLKRIEIDRYASSVMPRISKYQVGRNESSGGKNIHEIGQQSRDVDLLEGHSVIRLDKIADVGLQQRSIDGRNGLPILSTCSTQSERFLGDRQKQVDQLSRFVFQPAHHAVTDQADHPLAVHVRMRVRETGRTRRPFS